MTPCRTVAELEAELSALTAAADRAGRALACLFSTSDEFEAALIRIRRAQGAFRPRRRYGRRIALAFATLFLAAAFLMN